MTGTKSKWAAADSYNLHAFGQTDGPWPIGHPLPLPIWTRNSKRRLVIEKVINLGGSCHCVVARLKILIFLYRFGNMKISAVSLK